MAGAARSEAAETMYWNNYGATPPSIGFAGLDGSGGGSLNLSGAALKEPEGMAYDSVTNRLFVAGSNGITAINLDGSGASVFAPPGAPVESPQGLTLDPATRMIYWINATAKTISRANLDGSSGGLLNTAGTEVEAYRLAIDPSAGRVYWFQGTVPGQEIMYANTNGSGVGSISTAGATPNTFASGIAVDPAGGRIYWVNYIPKSSTNDVSHANLNGSGGGADIPAGSVPYNDPYGLTLDPTIGQIRWANYENKTEAKGAFGFLNLAGGGGGINIATAPLSEPQDPLILKTPSGIGAPAVTRSKTSRVALSCSPGVWGADYPGSFVYQAPRSLAYQWSNNGAPIAGATAATLTAKSAGEYSCTVTATNQEGSTAQISAPLSVKAAKLKLTTKKVARAKAGKLATFKLNAANQGDLGTVNAQVCVKLLGASKKALKAPRCRRLGKIVGAKKKGGTLKLKVKPSADPGSYKLKFIFKGASGKAIKAKVVVLG
ncbi:MAG: hypothetical protein H0X42_00330 [Solirubrobacterales bacterium]|nr:hypothetical protein [Solirubrobacterales bacterium]